MNKKCARCEKTVYPIEELKCLDKIWHKQCFRCNECNMTLNMRTYKGFNKQPYCEAFPVALYATFGTFPRYSSLSYWYEYEGRPDETCYTSSFGGVTDVIHRVSISDQVETPPRPRYPPTSFSSLQLLKSYMSNSTSEDRLNGLHVHTSRGVSYGPMWKNARSDPELELASSGNARFAPDLAHIWTIRNAYFGGRKVQRATIAIDLNCQRQGDREYSNLYNLSHPKYHDSLVNVPHGGSARHDAP
uniref:LIM zinc-binding domain-containing protein n=1 Tax=Timema tahoe TaxID=61484 RepID=A0A7R9IRQ4_9NEOP|nr:unnamed protein product [Timema tahoe]